MNDKITRRVSDIAEYKDLVDAADTLDLEPVKHRFEGGWETKDSIPCWPKESDVVKTGRKYYHVRMDGEICKIHPCESSSEAGTVLVTLR